MKNDLGRNDPCHCGSGKKYKLCCLSQDEAKAREAREREQEAAGQTSSAAAPPAAAIPHSREHRHQTAQPWKRKEATRGTPRFTAPRRSGGS